MPKIAYTSKRFSAESLEVIATAEQICRDYAAQGFDLTLRQLYYQFVARDILPNSQKSYKRLGSIVNDARLAGMIDWYHITDRTRNLRSLAHWDSPQQIIDAVAAQYRTDRWANQTHPVEVWIEKDALVGVVATTCNRLDVPFFSCRGYTSQSEIWGAGQRLGRYSDRGQEPIIIHLGDHDPSGIDMTRDIEDRLDLFGARAQVIRIALNYDQVERYGPPPNPAKLTDSRAVGYIERHGYSSWELDALDPATLSALIEDEIFAWRNADRWQADTETMEDERTVLSLIKENWTLVRDYVHELDA